MVIRKSRTQCGFFRVLEILEDLAGFWYRVGFHEFGTKFLGPRKIVDVDFEKVL